MAIRIDTLPLGELQANCYLLSNSERQTAVAIDPGGEISPLLTLLRRRERKLTHILLTHAHFDHIGGVADLVEATGAVLAAHADDVPLLRRRGGALEWGYEARACPEPSLLLQPGQILETEVARLTVLWVPGHTPGHLAFYWMDAQSVFTGDALFQGSIGRTDLPGGDFDQLMRSIRESLLTLPDDTVVYPGHGPTTTVGEEKQFNPFLTD
jgi:glyoxylase-like metal-dependent hydrolase (beta-lactamase superfamily II)